MSVFTIADLHLSSDGSKSMEKFGPRWTGYTEKLRRNWTAVVKETDTVVIPGDISWALKLEDSLPDLQFLNALPGQKLIGKGNHDFWWSTASKMNAFFTEHKLDTLRILYNNAYLVENKILCGTRGWFLEEEQQKTAGEADYTRIVNREVIRLRMSLDAARKFQPDGSVPLPILVFLHFPPVWNGFICREFIDLFHEYGIHSCYFGHIHGAPYAPRSFVFEDIRFVFIAADAVHFAPVPV